jgi:hypothetical protein
MDIVVSLVKLFCAKFKQNCVFELKLRMCALSTPSCNNCSMSNKSQKIWLEKEKIKSLICVEIFENQTYNLSLC